MKKVYLLLVASLFSLTVQAQCVNASNTFLWSDAGLPWSKDCVTGKPELGKAFTHTLTNITQASINAITSPAANAVPSGNFVNVIYLPAGTYSLSSAVTIPSRWVLKGAGITSIINIPSSAPLNSGITLNGTISGIEGLKIVNNTSNSCSGTSGGNHAIVLNAEKCWVKAVESQFGGTGGHIQLTSNANFAEISGCYIHDSKCFSDAGGGRAYGIRIDGADNCLIVNNVLRRLRHHVLPQLLADENVIAYNYMYDPEACNYAALICWAADWTVGAVDFHGDGQASNSTPGDGPQDNLIEGNILSSDAKIKYYQGNKGNNTGRDVIFKNIGEEIWVSDVPEQAFCASGNIMADGITGSNYTMCCTNVPNVSSLYYSGTPSWWTSGAYPSTASSNNPAKQRDALSNKTYLHCGINAVLSATTTVQPCSTIFVQTTQVSTNPGSITVNVSGSTAPYTVTLTGSSNQTQTITTGSSCTFTGLYAGNYTITVSKPFHIPFTTTANISCVNVQVGRAMEEEAQASENVQNVQTTLPTPVLDLIAYPNPMSTEMTIEYALETEDVISIELLNSMGQVVKRLENQSSKAAGAHTLVFNRDGLPTGVYQAIFKSKHYNKVFRIVVE